ncbi:hypothetical protein K439DRAFT_1616891 [Ramaria rubella]|nr:hypothetical protein K439DRAFT_1616891 [Ramaria rubella]
MNQPIDSWINQTLAMHFPQQPSRAPVSTPGSQDVGLPAPSAPHNITGAYPSPLASITTRMRDVGLGLAPVVSIATLEQDMTRRNIQQGQRDLRSTVHGRNTEVRRAPIVTSGPQNSVTFGMSFQFKVPHPPQGNLPPQPHYVETPTPAHFQTTAPTINMGGNLSHLISSSSPAINAPTLPEVHVIT